MNRRFKDVLLIIIVAYCASARVAHAYCPPGSEYESCEREEQQREEQQREEQQREEQQREEQQREEQQREEQQREEQRREEQQREEQRREEQRREEQQREEQRREGQQREEQQREEQLREQRAEQQREEQQRLTHAGTSMPVNEHPAQTERPRYEPPRNGTRGLPVNSAPAYAPNPAPLERAYRGVAPSAPNIPRNTETLPRQPIPQTPARRVDLINATIDQQLNRGRHPAQTQTELINAAIDRQLNPTREPPRPHSIVQPARSEIPVIGKPVHGGPATPGHLPVTVAPGTGGTKAPGFGASPPAPGKMPPAGPPASVRPAPQVPASNGAPARPPYGAAPPGAIGASNTAPAGTGGQWLSAQQVGSMDWDCRYLYNDYYNMQKAGYPYGMTIQQWMAGCWPPSSSNTPAKPPAKSLPAQALGVATPQAQNGAAQVASENQDQSGGGPSPDSGDAPDPNYPDVLIPTDETIADAGNGEQDVAQPPPPTSDASVSAPLSADFEQDTSEDLAQNAPQPAAPPNAPPPPDQDVPTAPSAPAQQPATTDDSEPTLTDPSLQPSFEAVPSSAPSNYALLVSGGTPPPSNSAEDAADAALPAAPQGTGAYLGTDSVAADTVAKAKALYEQVHSVYEVVRHPITALSKFYKAQFCNDPDTVQFCPDQLLQSVAENPGNSDQDTQNKRDAFVDYEAPLYDDVQNNASGVYSDGGGN